MTPSQSELETRLIQILGRNQSLGKSEQEAVPALVKKALENNGNKVAAANAIERICDLPYGAQIIFMLEFLGCVKDSEKIINSRNQDWLVNLISAMQIMQERNTIQDHPSWSREIPGSLHSEVVLAIAPLFSNLKPLSRKKAEFILGKRQVKPSPRLPKLRYPGNGDITTFEKRLCELPGVRKLFSNGGETIPGAALFSRLSLNNHFRHVFMEKLNENGVYWCVEPLDPKIAKVRNKCLLSILRIQHTIPLLHGPRMLIEEGSDFSLFNNAEFSESLGGFFSSYRTHILILRNDALGNSGRQSIIAHELEHLIQSFLGGSDSIRKHLMEYGAFLAALLCVDDKKMLRMLERFSSIANSDFDGRMRYVHRLAIEEIMADLGSTPLNDAILARQAVRKLMDGFYLKHFGIAYSVLEGAAGKISNPYG